MTIDLKAIRAAAEAATPGPWEAAGPSFGMPLPKYINCVIVENEDGDADDICIAPIGCNEISTEDLTYIATANPATILALLDRLEAAEKALAEPAQATCNCRWEGGTQVQQCTLHEAHVAAIHEWAERAKTAEKKLAEPVVKDCLTTEPAVEPVAEVYQRMTGGNSFPGTGIRWLDGVDLIPAGTKLYTSPPPPAEVPLLSDDEIYEMYSEPRSDAEMLAFGREVEKSVRRNAGL